jgi:DNA-binding MarR family transcriptional regulator
MSRNDRKRQQLLETVTDEGRRMSTRAVLLHSAIADKLGLSPSDHKCADVIHSQAEPLTAGRLAELTGLSTGAITGVLDRLEHAGFVARAHDPNDRRRVVVRYTPERAPDLRPFFGPLRAAMLKFCERYSNAELDVILSFMRGSGAVVAEQVARLATLDVHSAGAKLVRAEPAIAAGAVPVAEPPADAVRALPKRQRRRQVS